MTPVPLDDRGLLLGDGLFETVLAIDGKLEAVDLHLDRLAAGCRSLGLPAPDRDQALRLMSAAALDCAAPRAAVRLTLTAGSGGRGLDRPAEPLLRLAATAAAAPSPEGPARLAVAAARRNEGSPASRLKTLSYLDNVLARDEARSRGFDEALMLNNRGEVACAAAANLFWLAAGELCTPALECGVLAGTMRSRLMAAARAELGLVVREVAASLEAVMEAEGVCLTNALIGVRPVSAIEERSFESGEIARRLARAVRFAG